MTENCEDLEQKLSSIIKAFDDAINTLEFFIDDIKSNGMYHIEWILEREQLDYVRTFDLPDQDCSKKEFERKLINDAEKVVKILKNLKSPLENVQPLEKSKNKYIYFALSGGFSKSGIDFASWNEIFHSKLMEIDEVCNEWNRCVGTC